MKFLTKGIFLTISVILTIIFCVVVYLGTEYCFNDVACRAMRSAVLDDRLIFTLLFPVLLLFSAITYPLPAIVFERWRLFTLWAVPVTIIATWWLLSIETGGSIGGAIEEMMIGTVVLLLYGIYFVTSLAIIGITWFRATRTSKS